MLSEKNRALIEKALNRVHKVNGDVRCSIPAFELVVSDALDAARHQAQEEAKAVSVEGNSSSGGAETPCGSRDDQAVGATAALATGYYDGFVDGIMRQPWDAAADWAALQAQAYAKTGARPPFLPVRAADTTDDLIARLRLAAGAFAREFPQYGGGIYSEAAERLSYGATASTTPDTGAEKVAAVVEDEGSREALNPLPNQHTRDRIAELEAILRPVANLYGTKPPYVVIGRTVSEAHFALQAKEAE